ncbi:MAG: QueG-associated DUF1730 domain-containing protein [Caldilineaceae bacterium]
MALLNAPPNHQFTRAVKRKAQSLGFDACRIIPVTTAPHADFFVAWIGEGRAGEMHYLERNLAKRQTPHLLREPATPDFHSLLVLTIDYHQFDLPPAIRNDPSRGLIASYAWGDDYHEIIRPLLYELDAFIRSQAGRPTPGKGLVDTGPVLERDWAQQAGLGFTGKNCCTIHPIKGSWLLLATLLAPEEFIYDQVPQPVNAPCVTPNAVLAGLPANHAYGSWEIPLVESEESSKIQNLKSKIGTCGRCTRCLTACPTAAFVGPYHLDPQRCISYWTIEAKQPIPRELRPLFGNRIFGCDICQEVCPWNQRLPERTPLLAGLAAQSERIAPPLLEGFTQSTPYWLDQEAFSTRFRRSPVKRTKRQGMLRNVCVALGNWSDPQVVGSLGIALQDIEASVRGHAAWALGQVLQKHRVESAYNRLLAAQATETNPWVREEIQYALG